MGMQLYRTKRAGLWPSGIAKGTYLIRPRIGFVRLYICNLGEPGHEYILPHA